MGLIAGKSECFLHQLLHSQINRCNLTRLYNDMLYPCGIRCERIVRFPKDAVVLVVQDIQVNEMVIYFLNIYKKVVLHVKMKIKHRIILSNINIKIK